MVTIFSNLILDNMPLVLQTLIVKEDGTEEGVVNTVNFTGDVDVTVSGNEATVDITGGGGTPPLLPTTGTGTATGAVVGDLATNDLTISNGGAIDETANSFTRTAGTHTMNAAGQEFLLLDGTGGAEQSILTARNTTDDGNRTRFRAFVGNTTANFNIHAEFNDGDNEAQIQGFADATTSSITHTADDHYFNGNVTGASITTKVLMISRNNFWSGSY